jgi:hypothetical protein
MAWPKAYGAVPACEENRRRAAAICGGGVSAGGVQLAIIQRIGNVAKEAWRKHRRKLSMRNWRWLAALWQKRLHQPPANPSCRLLASAANQHLWRGIKRRRESCRGAKAIESYSNRAAASRQLQRTASANGVMAAAESGGGGSAMAA